MSRKAIKSTALMLALCTTVTLFAACGKTGPAEDTAGASANTAAASSSAAAPSEAVKLDPVTLEFYLPSGSANVNDLDLVLEEFYKQTKETLNTTLHFNFTTFDDIGQKVSLKLAAGEQVDSAFAAQWTNPSLDQMTSKGQLVALDKYFTDDNYPGLKKAFTQDYLKNNSFKDAKGETHVYGIPFSHSFSGGSAIYYRQDLAEKYGISDIQSFEDLTRFYDAILQNEKGMIPFSYLGTTDALAETLVLNMLPATEKHNFDITTFNGEYGVAIKDDGTAYVANTVNPFADPEFLKLLPEPLKTIDPYLGYNTAREWYKKGYLEKDILSQKDAEAQFKAGKAASYLRGLDTYTSIQVALEKGIAGAKLGTFIVNHGLRTGTPKELDTDFKSWNFACVPVTSKNADRTMAFYNWLFADQKNHDLFELGIEGKHWVADGTSKYSLPAGLTADKSYNFTSATLTWNPTMIRYDAATPDFVVEAMNRLSDTNFYYKRPLTGFNFVSDSLKSEVAKMNDLKTLKLAAANGVIDNIPAALGDIQKRKDKAGFQKIREELTKQINAFLKENPYEGQ